MGNSEVGHLNLGAGRSVPQDLARIDDAIADGSFFENEALVGACERARASPRGRLHLLGLVSDGGVHAGWGHIEACIELAAGRGCPTSSHALTDGRDTSPTGGAAYMEEVERWLRSAGRVGTVGGRYYAMDRDSPLGAHQARLRRDRPRERPRAPSAAGAIASAYEADVTDEFIEADRDRRLRRDGATATWSSPSTSAPTGSARSSRALADRGFDGFDRGDAPGPT